VRASGPVDSQTRRVARIFDSLPRLGQVAADASAGCAIARTSCVRYQAARYCRGVKVFVVTRGDKRLGALREERTDEGEFALGFSDGFDPAARTHIERTIDDTDAFDRQAGLLRTDAPNPLMSRTDPGWFGLLVVPALLREGYDLDEVELPDA